jgi:hypothetical protein
VSSFYQGLGIIAVTELIKISDEAAYNPKCPAASVVLDQCLV